MKCSLTKMGRKKWNFKMFLKHLYTFSVVRESFAAYLFCLIIACELQSTHLFSLVLKNHLRIKYNVFKIYKTLYENTFDITTCR